MRDHLDQGVERGGRSASRDRSKAGAPGKKMNGMDLLQENSEDAPAISSADLDQLMADMDFDDPLIDEPAKTTTTTSAAPTTTTTTTTTASEEKPAGLAGALPGGLGAGLSSIPNPMGEAGGAIMGKLGDVVKDNPVTGLLSAGKSSLFKKFGL